MEDIVVIAKCPSCKKTKEYKMPINFTPVCGDCLFVPMVVKTIKTKIKQHVAKKNKGNLGLIQEIKNSDHKPFKHLTLEETKNITAKINKNGSTRFSNK